MISETRHPIYCSCCTLLFAEWQRDVLVVTPRHHSNPHPNLVTVDMFLDRMTAEQMEDLARRIERRLVKSTVDIT